jgi:hypothetical protein
MRAGSLVKGYQGVPYHEQECMMDVGLILEMALGPSPMVSSFWSRLV